MPVQVAAALLIVVGLYQDQPPPAHTGGFGEPTCYACHFDGDINAPGGALEVNGLPTAYTPGETYPVRVRLARTGLERGGFQLSARFAEGVQAGQFEATDETIAVDHQNQIAYVRHTPLGTTPVTPDSIHWVLNWTAPDAASGPVAFHAAANASNGDESEFGDSIYTFETEVEENETVTDADDGTFERVNYNNPDAVADLGVGLWAWPLPMDYDEDGDMDLLVSTVDVPFNGLYFFENTSGESFPVFAPPVRLHDGIRNVQLSYVDQQPVVLVPGAMLEEFSDTFDEKRRPLFPSDSIAPDIQKIRFNQWKLVDFEGDGDQDLLVGLDDWDEYGWDNAFDDSGNWTNGPLHGYVYLLENQDGTYTNQGRLEAGGAPIDVYGAPTPNMADFDGDGDLDLITGEFLDRLTWFENTGTRERPTFASGRHLTNAEGVIRMDLEMIIPVVVDWDGDGDQDLVVGDEDGRVALIENTGAVEDQMPVFEAPAYFKQQADHLKFGALATPVGVDWDDDGDEDLISGNTAGYVAFIENLDGGDLPRWAPPRLLEAGGEVLRIMAGENGSIQGPAEAKWGYTAPSVVDWDGDGLKDLLLNSIWGKVVWYQNVGERGSPRLASAQPVRVAWEGTPPKPEWTWWEPEDGTLATQWRTTPYAIDWNEDGLMDLVMLDHEGFLSYFERFERDGERLLRPGQRIFHGVEASGYVGKNEVVDDRAGPLQLNAAQFGGSGRRKFAFADWDQDGDLDLLVNSTNIALFRNEGEADGKVVLRHMGDLTDQRLAGHTTSPTTVDWNGDGRPDLLMGAEDGHFYYLENR